MQGLPARRRFIDLPFRIHGGDPSWVPPLRYAVWDRLSKRHPAAEHQEWALWTAHRNGRPVARIGACVDHLFDEFQGRVRWHGHAARGDLAAALDRARVLIAPHRRVYPGDQASGVPWRGDSMKLYDYFARGRPAVLTYTEGHTIDPPPHLYVASDADAFAAAIVAADNEPESWADERRRWALRQSWPSRWGIWSAAVFGVDSGP